MSVGPSSTLRVYGLGARLDVEVAGESAELVGQALSRAWTRCLLAGDLDAPPGAPVSVEAPPMGDHAAQVATLMMTTTQQITRALIAARLGGLFLFHAGAVCTPGGETVAFVAPGRTGKTTLAAALGRHYGYVTDETVGVEFDGTVRPYPKPLSLRRGQGPKVETSPDELELQPTPGSARLARIVFLQRDHPEDAVEPEELDTLDAVTLLAEQMSGLGRTPRGLQRLAALLERTGPVRVMHYREAGTLAPVLAELLEGER